MESRQIFRSAGRFRVAAVVSSALLAAVASSSARAADGDDGQGSFLSTMAQMVGLGSNSNPAAPKIDYRPRAPLVLPQSMDLPPPARSAEARNPAWPKDPDVMAARRAEDLSRAPAQQGGEDPPMSFTAMQKDRIPASADPDNYKNCEMYESQCDPHTIWSQLKIKTGDPNGMKSTPVMLAGQEPKREYLTEPPPGYLTPTQVVKRGWELPKNKNEDDNSNVYYLEQAGHKVSQDDPSDN
jgi:hypothetical protein